MKADGSDALTKLEGNNQVQQKKQQRDPFTEWVARNQKAIQALLPEHMDLKRFARMTLQAILENPRILACHPDSIVKAIMDAAKAGLEIDGKRACIVPYKGRAEFQLMYMGALEYCYRTGEYEEVTAKEVYERDFFEYEYGLDAKLKHIPAQGDRGEITHFYAYYKLKNGGRDFVVMTVEDIVHHAKRYSKSYDDPNGAWQTNFEGMARKTVLLQVTKYAPKSIVRYVDADVRDIARLEPEPIAQRPLKPEDFPTLPAPEEVVDDDKQQQKQKAEKPQTKKKRRGRPKKTEEEEAPEKTVSSPPPAADQPPTSKPEAATSSPMTPPAHQTAEKKSAIDIVLGKNDTAEKARSEEKPEPQDKNNKELPLY